MSSDLVPSHARWSFPAGSANLTQYQFVQINAAGQIVTPAASGIYALVLDDAPALAGATITNDMPSGGFVVGAYYSCVFSTICVQKVITGANLAVGQAVMTNASGFAVPATGTGVILGYTMQASNTGDIVRIAPV